jgi:hypothetical protein
MKSSWPSLPYLEAFIAESGVAIWCRFPVDVFKKHVVTALKAVVEVCTWSPFSDAADAPTSVEVCTWYPFMWYPFMIECANPAFFRGCHP